MQPVSTSSQVPLPTGGTAGPVGYQTTVCDALNWALERLSHSSDSETAKKHMQNISDILNPPPTATPSAVPPVITGPSAPVVDESQGE